MADVPGKFYRATKVRTGVAPSSAGSIEGEVLPPVNPPGSSLNSVGLTMPSAFTVSNSPLTANGTIGVTGAGTVAQYIRGDGSLADFPESSGGGSSVSYYLNGSVDQGTIGGIAYKELSKVPILGAGTDFTINADGYIASFITDAGDPSLLEIPGGNWNFETYFSASSSGGTPTFYVELYKVSGTTATLIASSSSAPELIAFGTNLTPYFSSLAVPTTTLALTDRLAVRYYVTHSGRTITLHTENNHLCQIITTFTTGLTALNGLTAQVQNFAVGTTGTDFNIASATATHTFNLPTASATNRGALSSADWSTFNAKQPAGNYVTLDTSQTITGIKTFSQDIIVNGVNVGRGGGTITSNTIVGEYALNANTTGNSNTAIGQASMVSNTTGASNTAVGRGALEKNTTAIWNCGIGTFSLFGNTTGSSNIAVGNGAGGFIADGITENSITNNSVFLGGNTKALANNQTNQIVIGHNAIGGGSNTVVIGNSSILSNRFFGTMQIGTINNGVGDFITTDANGVLTKRTNAEVRTDIGAGTVTSVAALTLGTSGTDLSSTVANGTTTPVITLNVPTASATNRGALSAADWTTFNNKQNALTNPVTGTGTSGQVAYFTGTSAISSESNLFWDATNDRLGIATNTPATTLEVNGVALFTGTSLSGNTKAGVYILDSRIISLNGSGARDLNIDSQNLIISTGVSYAESMRVFSSRNVHIGPTPASDNGARLQVSGEVNINSGATRGLRIDTNNGVQGISLSPNSIFGVDEPGVGNGRFIINTSGNVGIANNSPSFRLDVSGTGRYLQNNSSVGNATGITLQQSGSGDIAISYQLTGSREFLMGIDNSDSDSFKINHITGSSDFNNVGLAITTTGAATFSNTLRTLGDFYAASGTSTAASIRFWDANSGLYHPGSDALGFITSGTQKMVILANGNVLIGTQSDAGSSFRLQVARTGGSNYLNVITDNNAGYDCAMLFSDGTNQVYAGMMRGSTGLTGAYTIWTGGSARVNVNSNGNVLVGSGTPNSKLQVSGSVSFPHTTKSENYTLDASDYTVGFDCASNRTANLPDATTCAGRIYVIYQYNTGNFGSRYVTLDGNGSQTINGLTTVSLQYYYDYSSLMIQSNGSNWIIIADAAYPVPV